MANVVIGLDLGTGGVRAIAVDLAGQVIAQQTIGYPLLTPHPGWTEQHPADWVKASLTALSDVTQQLGEHQVIALGLSGQMHGMVPLNADGNVIRPALLWNDQRTGEAVAQIEAIVPRQDLIQRTGNPAITGFQLPKLIWLRTAEPQAYAQVQHVLLPKDYLAYVLTGNFVTEPSDASGIGCLNLATRQWDEDILSALHLSSAWFPAVIASTAIAGQLKSDIATQIGLPTGLPVVAGGGDNAAAAIGLGISSSHSWQFSNESTTLENSVSLPNPPILGDSGSRSPQNWGTRGMKTAVNRGSLSIGTSGVIFVPCDRPVPDPNGRVHLFCHVDGGYHFLGVTLAAGGSLRWYRDTFAPHTSYPDLMELAAASSPGSHGVLFLPHLAGERSPYLDPDTRGAWVNLSLSHTQGDVIRAVLEGVAFSLRAVLEVIMELVPVHQLLSTGGGARSLTWLQILADVLQTELIAPKAEEGAAYGAAILAMVGVGAYPDLEAALRILPQARDTVQPHETAIYEPTFLRYKQLYEALKTVRESLIR